MNFKYILSFIVFLSLVFHGNAQNKSLEKKPNFLFILVDDQPFDALESSGRYPFLKTPNMQRLIEEGVMFENYFVV